MSKCPCKIITHYFVITDYGFIECSRNLWDSYSRYNLVLTDPFEMTDNYYFDTNLPTYDFCRSSMVTVAYFDDAEHGIRIPVFVRVHYYVEKEIN